MTARVDKSHQSCGPKMLRVAPGGEKLATGKLSCVRIGRRTLIKVADIEKLLDSGVTGALPRKAQVTP